MFKKVTTMQKSTVEILQNDIQKELKNILEFWGAKAVDNEHGGFAGEINAKGEQVRGAEKGLILNARILWTFSMAYNFLGDKEYLKIADRAYNYLVEYFWDKENGGLFWALNFEGKVSRNRKQIYGQGFGIYGFSEYYNATGNKESLNYAIQLFELIEKYSFDKKHGGYIEAFTVDWNPLSDFRLSEKDANYPKSMNTHLHILEPYSNLFRVWKNDKLKQQIKSLVNLFFNQIINPETHHFNLFFEKDWSVPLNIVSYGHDIEGAWLINEAAELISDIELFNKSKKISKKMVDAVLKEGITPDKSSVYYEKNEETGEYNKERHWWVQAEAMVGLLDTYKHTADKKYYDTFLKIWNYIKENIIDYEYGGWHEIIEDNGTVKNNNVKGSFWLCPYHNSRALIEVFTILDEVKNYNLK